MSGGHFNYSQNRINDVVEHLEYLLDDEEAQERRDTYSDATLQKFKEAADILKKAFVYAQRIDWLLSGDDGEETFHERLEEDLNKIEPDWVRVGDGTLHGAIDYWQDQTSKLKDKYLNSLERLAVVEQRLRVVQQQLLMSNALPRITDEIYNDYVGEAFIEIENGKPDWTQAAIDFAALLDEMKGKINESGGE